MNGQDYYDYLQEQNSAFTQESLEVSEASQALILASQALVNKGSKPTIQLLGIMETTSVIHILGPFSHRLSTVVDEPFVLIFSVDGQPVYAPLKSRLSAEQVELVANAMKKGLYDYCNTDSVPPDRRLGAPE